ncbi:hypothetical protein [Rhodoblastus sp.]|uniref:hypothetical protein n=1 Tax=Rhodoblastus sp. TaxID=1962975 RepID=UPI002635F16B|nr:hypothetical protein [Rhodoblastus sp.]
MTQAEAPSPSSSPPFPSGSFRARLLGAREITRGLHTIASLDLEVAAGGAAQRIEVEMLLHSPTPTARPVVLRNLRLLDTWRELAGVPAAVEGQRRGFETLMRDIAFATRGRPVQVEISPGPGSFGAAPKLTAVAGGGR